MRHDRKRIITGKTSSYREEGVRTNGYVEGLAIGTETIHPLYQKGRQDPQMYAQGG